MPYASAIWPDRWRVAGRRLQPFCLGHAFLLQRLGFPIEIKPESALGAGDLAVMLVVCSRTWAEAARLADSWRGPWLVRWLAPRCVWPAGRLLAVIALRRYFADAWRGPKLWISAETDQGPVDDPLRVLLCGLTQRLGYSHEQAMAIPLQRAIWEVCSYLASERKVEFYTEDDQRLAELVRAEKRKG